MTEEEKKLPPYSVFESEMIKRMREKYPELLGVQKEKSLLINPASAKPLKGEFFEELKPEPITSITEIPIIVDENIPKDTFYLIDTSIPREKFVWKPGEAFTAPEVEIRQKEADKHIDLMRQRLLFSMEMHSPRGILTGIVDEVKQHVLKKENFWFRQNTFNRMVIAVCVGLTLPNLVLFLLLYAGLGRF